MPSPGKEIVHTVFFRRALVAGLCALLGFWGSLILLFALVPKSWVASSDAYVVFLCACAFSVAGGVCGIACFKKIAGSQPLLKGIGAVTGFLLVLTVLAVENKMEMINRERGVKPAEPYLARHIALGSVAYILAQKVSTTVYRPHE